MESVFSWNVNIKTETANVPRLLTNKIYWMDKLGSHLGDNFKLLRENIIIMTGVLMLYSIIENIEYISTKILFIFVFVFYFVFRKYNNIILCLLTVTFLFSVIFFVFKIQCYYYILPNHKNKQFRLLIFLCLCKGDSWRFWTKTGLCICIFYCVD